MSQEAFSKVITRSMFDKDFRDAIADDTEHTLKIAGLKLTGEELAAIGTLNVSDWENMQINDINDRIGNVARVSSISIDI